MRTPGTRLRWKSLAEWMEAARKIKARRISAARHAAEAAHLASLPTELVERAPRDELAAFEVYARALEAPRGRRAQHPRTRLLDAIDRARRARRHRPMPAPELASPDEKPARVRKPGKPKPIFDAQTYHLWTIRLQRVRCGKKKCGVCKAKGGGHGPYWYAFFNVGRRVSSRYIGKVLPDFVRGPEQIIAKGTSGDHASSHSPRRSADRRLLRMSVPR